MRRYGALKGHVWKLMGEECENWLVVTGTMELYDFPFSWECHHPN